jgi:hypothetical protein
MTLPRRPTLTLAVVAAMLLGGCGHRSAQDDKRHLPLLVSMRRNTGQIWQTVSVRTDRRVEVGIFMGEHSGGGTHYVAFPLSGPRFARLRRLVARVESLPKNTYRNPALAEVPAVTDLEYIVTTPTRSIDADLSSEPRALRSLTEELSTLIESHAQAASTSRRRAPSQT